MPTPRRRRGTPGDKQPVPFDPTFPPPYGLFDLDPVIQTAAGPPARVRCFVRGCQHFLLPPTRETAGEVCPDHGITCTRSATFGYRNVRRNTITAHDLLATGIVHHPFKFESGRLGWEKSEDTLTFTVFRAFQEVGRLNQVARYITGREEEDEPRLFLWGIEAADDRLRPWDLLIEARQRFERSLPVKRPLTEPDIGLLLDGRYLVLIEAKFTSPNTHYTDGPRKDDQSLTKDELLTIYTDPRCPALDLEAAKKAEAVAYQLWRNVQFASYMASLAKPGTVPYFANLVRRGYERESFRGFQTLVRPEYLGRVVQVTWEELFVIAGLSGGRLLPLREYLLTKTANLAPAFDLGVF
jgi:hypothetical protein